MEIGQSHRYLRLEMGYKKKEKEEAADIKWQIFKDTLLWNVLNLCVINPRGGGGGGVLTLWVWIPTVGFAAAPILGF